MISDEHLRQTGLGSPPAITPEERAPMRMTLPKIPPYFTLDAWRGVAALWVVMLHACLPYVLNQHASFLSNPLYLVSVWGQLGVVIFFVISGYCITGAAYSTIAAGKSLAVFCTDRVRRIFPPYFAAVLLAVGLRGGTAFLQSRSLLPNYHYGLIPLSSGCRYWLTNLTLTQVPASEPDLLAVAWSLSYEVFFYILIACFLAIGILAKGAQPVRRLFLLVAGVGVLTCGSLLWLCISPSTCPFPLQLWYQFGFGSLLFLHVAIAASGQAASMPALKIGHRLTTLSALTLTAVRVVMLEESTTRVGHPSTRVQAITTLIFLALLFVLRPHDARLLRNKAWKPFIRCGAFSYSLYLVHLPLLPYIDGGLRRLGLTENLYLVVYLCQILVAIVAGWVFFVVVERRFISGRQMRRLAAE